MENLELENERLADIYSLSLMIQIAAAGVATSFLLIIFPNIETISLTTFMLGYYFRKKFYLPTVVLMVITWEILATMIFSTSGIIFPFKLLAWLLISLIANLSRIAGLRGKYEFAAMGVISALIYDLLVTIPYALIYAGSEGFLVVFYSSIVVGLYFSLLHMVGNALLFSLIPLVYRRIRVLLEANFESVLQVPRKTLPRGKMRVVLPLIMVVILISSIALYNPPEPVDVGQRQTYTLSISYGDVLANTSVNVVAWSNSTVFGLTNDSMDVEYRYYGPAIFVSGINSVVENQNRSNYYWIYYVDGQRGSQPSNQQVLDNISEIMWIYESG